ncbi:hypothetical protein QZH56_15360 [Streptomyces olivoreticuli]|uniref:hypothetical protein n=1 Tax=Streptomyces olivoreticuli TaxID=68246 RepID=UPI002658DAF6|nr:hypothetical protein [Streptomyces olivoreticuli]WKK26844.1 hypothetical protein QZH56_15360 [Streptomyces olivoreticuli]
MWESGAPFGDLVRQATADGTTWRKLAERALDPKTDYKASHTTLWKIANEQQVKIHPALVRAVAAAVGRPEREVQIAAAQQFVGLMAGDPLDVSTPTVGVVVAHVPGMTPEDMPKVQELLTRWSSAGKSET